MVHEIPNLCSTLRLYGVVELCGCHPSFSSRRRPFGSPPQCAKPLLPPPRSVVNFIELELLKFYIIQNYLSIYVGTNIIFSKIGAICHQLRVCSIYCYILTYMRKSRENRTQHSYKFGLQFVQFSIWYRRGINSLSNLVIQLREVCNHPNLLESAFDGSCKYHAIRGLYPPVNEIVEQCEKFCLLERLLKRLFAKKHKVLIFSQWTKVLDILDYYFSEKGFEVCEIDVCYLIKEIKVSKTSSGRKPLESCRLITKLITFITLGHNLPVSRALGIDFSINHQARPPFSVFNRGSFGRFSRTFRVSPCSKTGANRSLGSNLKLSPIQLDMAEDCLNHVMDLSELLPLYASLGEAEEAEGISKLWGL
ncbi:hypothetical protein Ahy_A02g008546 [Arachis hypogaea]|uniref:SNF2 N-terminal domain-containing protein n=1 Tax=Arachis hypogaea TaxID=3818 RepID=A0A445EFD1_ARAHY|nr:hypothetical protein Ahy_A02g008546 [Arachis hypogaea]